MLLLSFQLLFFFLLIVVVVIVVVIVVYTLLHNVRLFVFRPKELLDIINELPYVHILVVAVIVLSFLG